VHGTVQTIGKRIDHAWVETETGYIWEPESGEFMKKSYFYERAKPEVKAKYTAEEATIMVARTKHFGPWTEQERYQFLQAMQPQTIDGFKVIEAGICPYCHRGYSKGDYIARWYYDRGPREIRGQGVHIACFRKLEKEYPLPQLKWVREYWDRYLERNPLRVGRKDTDAGAFLAWQLEAAGDIIRELGKDIPDPAYIQQKLDRIKRELSSRDWTDPLSEGEWHRLAQTRELLKGLPTPTPLAGQLKMLLGAIINRDRPAIQKHLAEVEESLKLRWEEVNKMPKQPLYPHVPKSIKKGERGEVVDVIRGETSYGPFINTIYKEGDIYISTKLVFCSYEP